MCENCAVDESFNCGGGSSKLIGQKDFAVCVTQVYEMCMDLVKYPGRRPSRHRCVESELVSLVRQPILNIINQSKTT